MGSPENDQIHELKLGGKARPTRGAELATAGAAAAQKARIEAAYTVAINRPRDMDDVRDRILSACKRPKFAEAAIYAKPVGKEKIYGLSVRFAEEAARNMGNIQSESPVIYDDETQRIVSVTVTDLETNYTASAQVVIAKTVERKNKRGRVVIDERENSYGDTVYVVIATEDELSNKQNSAVSKAKRNLLLDMLPGDIMAEAYETLDKTRRGQIEADPAEAKRKLADAFSAIGVKPAALKAYIGHDLESCSPVEIAELRDTYQAINTGETTWAEVMQSKAEKAAPVDAVPPAKGRKAE